MAATNQLQAWFEGLFKPQVAEQLEDTAEPKEAFVFQVDGQDADPFHGLTKQDIKEHVIQTVFPDLPSQAPAVNGLNKRAVKAMAEAEEELHEIAQALGSGLSPSDGSPLTSEESQELVERAEGARERFWHAAAHVLPPKRHTKQVLGGVGAGVVLLGAAAWVVRAVRRRQHSRRQVGGLAHLVVPAAAAAAAAAEKRASLSSSPIDEEDWADVMSRANSTDGQLDDANAADQRAPDTVNSKPRPAVTNEHTGRLHAVDQDA